jgi:hypothetical protein
MKKKVETAFYINYKEKLNAATLAVAFLTRTPIYQGNLQDKKLHKHLCKALAHIECTKAILEERVSHIQVTLPEKQQGGA